MLVLYKGKKYLGQGINKKGGQCEVKYLTEPYPTDSVQEFEERKSDIIYYDTVFKPPVIPFRPVVDDEGKTVGRRTMFKYDV